MNLAVPSCVPEATGILLMFRVTLAMVPSACPARCVCDEQHAVQCAGRDLSSFPSGLPPATRLLIVSDNRIADLPALELTRLLELTYLDCSNNSLTRISEATFGRLRKLLYLDLSFNRFSRIEPQTFGALGSLVMLRLTDNPALSELHPQAFAESSALQVLDISRNNLTRLNVSAFMTWTGLKSLGLSGNPWMCVCDAQELCVWMHTDTIKFQDQRETVCEGPSYLQGYRLSELGFWLRRQCHPGLDHTDYLFFVTIGFVIFAAGTILAWASGMVIVLCQHCVRRRKEGPNMDVTEEETNNTMGKCSVQ